MKKSSFMQGAIIATVAIVITKILGILYAIPFYSLIGEQGGALYGYAYTIYDFFLTISIVGIPLAVSKLVSEYRGLKFYRSANESFKVMKTALFITGIVCFFIMFLSSDLTALWILGENSNPEMLKDLSFVIKLTSFAVIVVPVMSVTRGYLQGHTIMNVPSYSQILEQIARISVILIGGYLSAKVFNLDLKFTVGIATFGAFVGALISYFYITLNIRKNKLMLTSEESSKEDKGIKVKEVLKKVLFYSIPFVLISILRSAYNLVDMFTLNKTLLQLGYTLEDSNAIYSIISTWGAKLNSIIYSLSLGLVISLVPNITNSFIKNAHEELKNKINQVLGIVITIIIPLVVGMYILNEPVFYSFYGESKYGHLVYKYYLFLPLFTVLCNVSSVILQGVKREKTVIISMLIGFLFKIIFNIPMMHLFNFLNLSPYYGSIFTSILGFLITIIINLVYTFKKFNISIKNITLIAIKATIITIIMSLVLKLLSLIIPLVYNTRIEAILIIALYTVIGGITYLGIAYKIGLIQDVFGTTFIKKIISKFSFNKEKV